MKRIGLIIALSLCLPTTVFAQGPPGGEEIKESSLGEKIIGRESFSIPANLRLELGTNAIYVKGPYYQFTHISPYAQLDYRILDFLYLYAIVATQYSDLSYNIDLSGATLTLGAEAKANFISGGGLRAVIYRHKRFRIDVFGQYESLNESEAQPKNILLKWDTLKLDFNDVFKGHGYLDHSWQFVQVGAKIQFNAWRFHPYLVAGYSWLMFQIKIKIDDYATNAVKLLTSGDLQKIIPDRYSETRGEPIFYIGTEFRVTRHLSLNIAGMAFPAKEAIYFGQFSIIISH